MHLVRVPAAPACSKLCQLTGDDDLYAPTAGRPNRSTPALLRWQVSVYLDRLLDVDDTAYMHESVVSGGGGLQQQQQQPSRCCCGGAARVGRPGAHGLWRTRMQETSAACTCNLQMYFYLSWYDSTAEAKVLQSTAAMQMNGTGE